MEPGLILEEAALPQHDLCLSSCAKILYYVRNMKIYEERFVGFFIHARFLRDIMWLARMLEISYRVQSS